MASEIVVGIDFGTTYSGVSWAINGGKKTIRVVNDWPNPVSTVATSDKVPSALSYQDGQPYHWGYKVDLKEQSLSWFKLLLDPKNKIGQGSDKVMGLIKQLATLNKSPEDVAADYLRLLWQYTKEDIRKHRGGDWEEIYKVRAVLTVPAIWSPGAQDKTLKIARKAGLPDNISLVSEPEAAALAVLREKREDGEPLRVGDCFVVCDAGGGTVDLISYKICSLKPFQVEECVMGDGGLCGSVYLDQAFEITIRNMVGETQWEELRLKSKRMMMHDFEYYIKRSYAGDKQPYSVDLLDVKDNPAEGIDNDTITLKPTMLKTIFDHVINQIMRLVEKQIDEVEDKGSNVKAILLVGGFGTNRYMHKRLDEAHKTTGIQVLQINGGWSAICRGATMWGLEHSQQNPSPRRTVKSRIARYSYGIVCTLPFDESKGHLLRDRIRGSRGEWRAANQMSWMLKKGEKVEEGRHIHQPLTQVVPVNLEGTGMYNLWNALWYCADDEPPERAELSVKELCKVEYGIKRSKLWQEPIYKSPLTGERWRDSTFDLWIRLDQTTLEFSVKYKDEKVAWTEAKYKENF
ncbi:actin-like ATPase domain-containing protein [Macroventuria anomochaeta]|uniref:Actin-like ATPase domain-containing protein n=1 Tax=Macroventuria anomochaeta TaxID=301207 RepID=A0ACB6RUA8_9PLEO|nr:actin-like ATPase domain-containing protein [Macroventuria anomochaeta]KAF2624867.1 actin-like ATPase domain-containing protein [Macroventuria anomochaeta]